MSGEGKKGVVPPHVLSAIAENGSPEERRWAQEALKTDARLREGGAAEPKAGTSGMRDADDRERGSGRRRRDAVAVPRDVVAYLRHRYPRPEELSRVRLLRMAYLADWKSAIERGRQTTGLAWRFGEEGPYCRQAGRAVHLELSNAGEDRSGYPTLTVEDSELLDFVIGSVERKSYSEVEKLAYSTYPIAAHLERGSRLDLATLAREYECVKPALMPKEGT